jgi:cell wall-associated NlpC family hydrolase
MKGTWMIAVGLMSLAWGAGPQAVVIRPVLNMYSQPALDTDVVSQAIYGVTVRIVEERAGWLRIQTPDEYLGWAEGAGLRRMKERESYAASGQVATVESLFAHLYPVPSVTRRAPQITVPFETRLEVIEERPEDNGRWLGVRLADDGRAFVQRGDVVFDEKIRTIPELIELSRRFLGLPYTWGGTSSYGYDCSGFTQMLCRRGGVLIPRDAKPQALWQGMQNVERKDVEPGDLLYFGPSIEKISHTGFYVGGGQFIHATTNTHPVVQISTLDDEPWTTLFVAARHWKK